MTTDAEVDAPEWAIVEIMGHRQRSGLCQEVERFGAKFLRIDIPTDDGDVTEYYGGASIYAYRPASEEVARDVASTLYGVRPVKPTTYQIEPPRSEPLFDPLDDDERFF
jgi:hypothetical protein